MKHIKRLLFGFVALVVPTSTLLGLFYLFPKAMVLLIMAMLVGGLCYALGAIWESQGD